MADPTGGISPVHGVHGVSLSAEKLRMQRVHAQEKLASLAIRQQETQAEFKEWTELGTFDPIVMSKRFDTLDRRLREERKAKGSEAEEAPEVAEAADVEDLAQDYVKKNPELQARTLLIIRSHVEPDDDADAILAKVKKGYTDPSLADDVLDFLAETEVSGSELSKEIAKAKIKFTEMYLREIRAGKNIAAEARAFAQAGLGSPTALRDLYRDITGNPRTPLDLFEELFSHFDYEKMKKVIDFLLHSLGAELKSKGPSISHAELQKLLTETRSMQAILGVYRFFKMRMRLIISFFSREDLALPARVGYEALARQFMRLINERYPSPDKILKFAALLGLSEEAAAQIIIFTQYRDALRQVSPNLFRSEKHRQELLMSTIEALSDLEDMLEEDDDEDEEEKK